MSREAPRIIVEPLERALLDGVHEFAGEPERIHVDLGLVPVFADERPLVGLAGLIDWRECGRLSALVRSGFCTGAYAEQVLVPGTQRLPLARLVLVGLGPKQDFDEDRAREVARRFVQISRGLRATRVLLALPSCGTGRSLTEATLEGLLAALVEPEPEPEPEPVAEPATELGSSVGDEPAVGDEGPSERAPTADLEGPETVDPSASGAASAAALASQASPASLARASESEGIHEAIQWWVTADGAVVPRLRRVLSGPPRAARGGAGLHT